MHVIELVDGFLRVGQKLVDALALFGIRNAVHRLQLRVDRFQPCGGLAGFGGAFHQLPIHPQLGAKTQCLTDAEHQGQIYRPWLLLLHRLHRATAGGQQGVQFFQRGFGQYLTQAFAIVIAHVVLHLGHGFRRGHRRWVNFKQYLLAVIECAIYLRRQRVVIGFQQVERAQQIHGIVGIRHFPQQRALHRRGGSGNRRAGLLRGVGHWQQQRAQQQSKSFAGHGASLAVVAGLA